MALLRSFRSSSKFTGNGVDIADSGTGPLELAVDAIETTNIVDGAVAPEKLEGGAASPGNNKVYGTDAGGALGFKDDPTVPASSGVPEFVQLTDAAATIDLEYVGDTAPSSFVESPVGTYTLTVPTGVVLKSGIFQGGSGTVSGGQLTLKFVDTDGRTVDFIPAVIRTDTYDQVGLALSGIGPTHDDSVAGTLTAVFQNLNYTTFKVNLSFVNSKIPV